jgi:DNA-directed RNA polymerase subunit M/transcription elongation factor TFIIS
LAGKGVVKCPECGFDVYMPVKTWILTPKTRNGAAVRISLYECPVCFYKWRLRESLVRSV